MTQSENLGFLSVETQKYAKGGGDYQSYITFGGQTSESVTDFRLTYVAPIMVSMARCQIFCDSETFGTYSLYGVKFSGEQVTIGENLSGDSGDLDFTDLNAEGGIIKTLIFQCDKGCDGLEDSAGLWVQGVMQYESGGTITSESTLNIETTGNIEEMNITSPCIVSSTSRLELQGAVVDPMSSYKTGDQLTLKFTIPAGDAVVRNPVVATLIPPGLTYDDSDFFLYNSGYSGETTHLSGETLPTTEICDQESGQTLLRYTWADMTVGFRDSLELYCKCTVNAQATGALSLTGILGNYGNYTEVTGISYADEDDMDNDGIVEEDLAQTEDISLEVLQESPFLLTKTVKGDLDQSLSTAGYATAGGTAIYVLTLANVGSTDLTSVEMVDILPYVGDRQVLDPSVSRGSEYNIFPTGTVTAFIMDSTMEKQASTSDLLVEYSTSHDPMRFDAAGTGVIGVGTWSETPPSNISLLASVKVTTQNGVVLSPNQKIQVFIPVKTPVGAPEKSIAYNSVATLVYEEGVELLPEESSDISLTIADSALASVGQFVWDDENGDGLYSPGEAGVNGVTVALYDKGENLLAQTLTCDHMNGEAGYYRFCGLESGEYQVKFIPTGADTLTVQNLTSDLGSKPDPETGFTPLFTLAEGEDNVLENAGVLVESTQPTRTQAITDLIESVALVQTALSHILNSEGEKIQKAVALNLTIAETLAVNTSVQSMVETITILETVLKEKVETVHG